MAPPSVLTGGGLVGAAGAMTAWVMQPVGSGDTLLAVIGITIVSTLFGMLSSLSRITPRETGRAWKQMLFNAGAVWLMALALCLKMKVDLPSCALLGLGIGLAGSAALEILERGTLAVANRILGTSGMATKEDLQEKVVEVERKIGDVRDAAHVAVAEQAIEVRTIKHALPTLPVASSPDSE